MTKLAILSTVLISLSGCSITSQKTYITHCGDVELKNNNAPATNTKADFNAEVDLDNQGDDSQKTHNSGVPIRRKSNQLSK